MTQPPFDADAVIAAMSGLLRLEIPPESRPGVRSFLEAADRTAQLVLSFPLPDDAELAPVFSA